MKRSSVALAALLLMEVALAQMTGNIEVYEGLVFGIGKGTLAIICFVIFSVILCLFKDCVSMPNCCVGLGIILPIIVFVIIRLLPVKSLESDSEKSDKLPTDPYMVKTGWAIALLAMTCLCLCLVMLGSNFTTQLIARRIDSVNVRDLKLKQEKEAERIQYLNNGG